MQRHTDLPQQESFTSWPLSLSCSCSVVCTRLPATQPGSSLTAERQSPCYITQGCYLVNNYKVVWWCLCTMLPASTGFLHGTSSLPGWPSEEYMCTLAKILFTGGKDFLKHSFPLSCLHKCTLWELTGTACWYVVGDGEQEIDLLTSSPKAQKIKKTTHWLFFLYSYHKLFWGGELFIYLLI